MIMMIKRVGELPQVVDLEDDYNTYSKAVGGMISPLYLDNDVVLYCNDEGKCIGLEHNLYLGDQEISGNIICVGDDGRGGSKGLSDTQVAYLTKLLTPVADEYQTFIDQYFKDHPVPWQVWSFENKRPGCFILRQIDTTSVIAFLRNMKNPRIRASNIEALGIVQNRGLDLSDVLYHMAEQMARKGL